MALLRQAPGPQWGRVWLGSQGRQCPTYALEATCSLEGWGPQEDGTQAACNLASVQGAALPHKSVNWLPAPGDCGLLDLVLALGIKEDFSACLSEQCDQSSPVPLKTRPFLGSSDPQRSGLW